MTFLPCDPSYVNGVYTRDAFVTKVRRSLVRHRHYAFEPALASTEPSLASTEPLGESYQLTGRVVGPRGLPAQCPKPYVDIEARQNTVSHAPQTCIDDHGQLWDADCGQTWDSKGFLGYIRPGGWSDVGPV